MSAAHPLNELLSAWRDLRVRTTDPGQREDFLRWLRNIDLKPAMRLGWHLGISRRMDALTAAWGEPDFERRGQEISDEDIPDIPLGLWASFLSDGGSPSEGSFMPLGEGVEPDGRLLVHITWNPEALFRDGFLGTVEPDGLASTFGVTKTSPGFNFCFLADGFDAANFGGDDFYGHDAIVFTAPHLVTLNRETYDQECVFWGEDVDPSGMIHLRRRDSSIGSAWEVLDPEGRAVFADVDFGACMVWIGELDVEALNDLRGPRAYELRSFDFDTQDDDEVAAPALGFA